MTGLSTGGARPRRTSAAPLVLRPAAGLVAAGANRHDSPLLAPTLNAATTAVAQAPGRLAAQVTVHLDAGYNSHVTDRLLDQRGLHGRIAAPTDPHVVNSTCTWPPRSSP